MLRLQNMMCLMGLLFSLQLSAQRQLQIIPKPTKSIQFFEEKSIANQTINPTFQSKKTLSVFTSVEKQTQKQEVVVRSNTKYNARNWKCWDGKKEIALRWLNDSTFQFTMRFELEKHFYSFYNNAVLIDKWMSVQLPTVKQKVYIVPLVSLANDSFYYQNELNKIFKQAEIELEIAILPAFKTKIFSKKTVFSSQDSLEIYSGQMRLLRDQFFELNTNLPKEAYCLFVIPSFSDSSNLGFMLKNKIVGFVPFQANEKKLTAQLARTLAIGMGMLNPAWKSLDSVENRKENLMDSLGGSQLTFAQVEALRSESRTFSRFDVYENVPSNNGTIAFYFWKETHGWIDLTNQNPLEAIQRPFRKNFLISRFQVKYRILKPFFRWGGYYITIFNVLGFVLFFGLFLWLRKKIKNAWQKRKWRWGIVRKFAVWSLFLSATFGVYCSLPWGNAILERFTIISGPMPELDGMHLPAAKKELFTNPDFHKKRGSVLSAEILVQKSAHWEVKKRLPVLYFNVYQDENQKPIKMRFQYNSDTLKVEAWEYSARVTNHYMVFNYLDLNQKMTAQKVYSYDGKELESPNEKEDIAKRILVFVNGYRPTSVGHSLEENFQDIINNGFENKNSSNHIYPFDRYDYWQPWNQINLLFQQRINPTETYYADGHFSASTSNYGNILNFTRVAQSFPKRCPNPKKHTCYWTQNTDLRKYFVRKSHTENTLIMSANKAGFKYRKDHGRIAGKNLLQILNELPAFSENDTVYIVAHSMGYAYSIGMIESLRNKIQFGGFYILAPENAKSGFVKPAEWKEIWQYGSNLNQDFEDAPCLQDGVAPQTSVKGLPEENRLFIPKKSYAQKGFFDSHFVGYYTWILSIPQGEKGAVKQR
jgi:hypothetical protein